MKNSRGPNVDPFDSLRKIVEEVKEGKIPECSKEHWELAEEVIRSNPGEIKNVEEWAQRLADDIVEAAESDPK